MAYLPLRTVTLPEASERFYDAWLDDLDGRLSAPGADWHRITRDVLFEVWYPGLSDYDALVEDPATPATTRAALLGLDPRNVTLEPEYYADVDHARYARVKPLHWLWQSFDRSPLGGRQRARRGPVPPAPRAAPLRPRAAGTSSASITSSSPTATTWRWAMTAWCTATSCSTTAAASPWATG